MSIRQDDSCQNPMLLLEICLKRRNRLNRRGVLAILFAMISLDLDRTWPSLSSAFMLLLVRQSLSRSRRMTFPGDNSMLYIYLPLNKHLQNVILISTYSTQ